MRKRFQPFGEDMMLFETREKIKTMIREELRKGAVSLAFSGLIVVSTIGWEPVLAGELGTESSKVVGDKDYQFQVSVDRQNNQVSVHTLKSALEPPRDMSVKIYTDPEKSYTVQLHALSLNTQLPLYQGQLSQNTGSFMGVELRFESQGKGKVLRSPSE
jgi:hypothetical protein